MKIALSAESTIDLTPELLEKYNISIVPFTVILGENSYFDGDIDSQSLFDYVKEFKKLPKTSAINEYQYEEHFNKLLSTNDAIIHFSLSSKISSACGNAQIVANKMKNVYVIDTLSLSTGIALLAIYASKLINQELPIQDIVSKIKERIPYVQASFIIEKLNYLHKGGRCNSLQLLGANLLKLRPQIIVKEGKMISGKKYKGNMSIALKQYIQDTLNEFNTPDLSEVFITYTTSNPSDVTMIKTFLKEKGFKNIHETSAGATITTHCGENTLGILYINDSK